MSVQLAILGFLREKEFYGYELKKVMERFMSEWSDIKFGSIYYALEKLAQDGLVEPVREEKTGNNPSRTVYRITDAGRQSFQQSLEDNLRGFQRQYYPLDIGLFFSFNLDRARVAGMLREKAQFIQQLLDHLEGHETRLSGNPHIPEIASWLVRHSREHLKAELAWLHQLAERYEQHDLFNGLNVRDYLDLDRHHSTGEADGIHPSKRE